MCAEEYSQVLSDCWRKARRAHKCCACTDGIRPGDRYHYSSALYDGQFDAYKHCARCWRLLDALSAISREPVAWELDCGESWEDNFGAVPEEVAALAFITPDEAQRTLVPR